ncbi:MAG: amino-acid N-acetyltransferase [Verrucomicrobiota bacterium]
MNISDVRATLRYVPQFQGQTFVVSLDGGVIPSRNFSNFLIDLAILRSLGVRIVLVFGVAPQVGERMMASGKPTESYSAHGPTDSATLETAKEVVGQVTNKIMQDLAAAELKAVIADVLTVYPAGLLDGVDQEETGRVDRVDAGTISSFLDQKLVPLVGPLGYGPGGRQLYLNSDMIAAEIGVALKASKVIMADDALDCPLSSFRPTQLSYKEVDAFIDNVPEEITPRIRSKVNAAKTACNGGVSRFHIIPGNEEAALVAELFSNEGIGTMIYADTYERIRKATLTDVDSIISMTRRAMEEQQLVARSKEEIQMKLDDYWVIELDQNVIGCGALHLYAEQESAEIASLFVSKTEVSQGLGAKLIERLEDSAREAGMKRLVGFTTRAEDYFINKLGFQRDADLSWVSDERRRAYEESGRNSIGFWKPL